MEILKTIAGIRTYLNCHKQDKMIGLVPTMGALHLGHQSLIKRAVLETNLVVVSIFVNPLQFNPQEDLKQYPRQLEQDFLICEKLGVNVIFLPSVTELYGLSQLQISTENLSQTTQVVPPTFLMNNLCGKSRPGHFSGVATVVTKLLNIIQPDLAFFGEKDAQQLAIIRRLVKDLNIPTEIRGCPIIRENSGLALSSRNQYLTPEEKEKASILFASLQSAKSAFHQGQKDVNSLIDLVATMVKSLKEIQVDYIKIVDPKTLQNLTIIEDQALLAIAVYLGKTRLIDNIILKQTKPIIAIDGPAGAGKSTVTRQIAQKLNLLYLDTGAMYRAVTWLLIKHKIPLDHEAKIAEILAESKLELIPPLKPHLPLQVKINGEDLTQVIRSPEITNQVSKVAALKVVRKTLVNQQKQWGAKGGIVAEGRDLATTVFPQADLKIFLTASVQARAKRRLLDLQNQGYQEINLSQLEQEIIDRDHQDSTRTIAPLKKAPDAIEIITDDLTIEEVVAKIISFVNS